ncbi:acyl-CoA dehydrogenase family protein [Pseudonocardia eucalypti]|uniref:Acyl-CoA dehydrogenase family protein n=1 Tax=Pseudonocardia eucalypti TaxID=648755 RepID=A0ABP9Q8M0_9PSEU|nr:alkylation response protein AidB-like acyl-CoA dehydrogenase [Pseudonocardia eucalypti]
MFFALTDDQRDFDNVVRDYLTSEFDLEAVRRVVEDPGGDGHPEPLWRAMGEQGWLAVMVPEEHEGLGLGLVDAQVIARALGAGTAPGPWRGTVLAAEAIRLAGSNSQREQWLPKLATGAVAGALALRGTSESGWPAVEYAGVAGLIVVADGPGLRLLRADEVTVASQETFDGTTRLGSVSLADSAGEPLPGATAEVLEALHARSAVLIAADLVGNAREALRRTVDYDRDRRQFGVPVGSFQALKHDLADLHIAVTMAEHAVLYAAHALDTDHTDPATGTATALAVSVAKAKASETAARVTGAMIQYHGGIGYTWEHEAHFFYKRAKRLAGVGGTVDEQRERIAELTLG